MAHSFPPAPGRPDDPAGAGRYTQPALRPPLRRVLSRIILLAVTLALLFGIIALVRTANTPSGSVSSAPNRGVSSSTETTTTGVQTPNRSQAAPNFTLATLGGGSFHLASQRGHVVVLYFMATGCADCTPGSHDLGQALTNAAIPGAEALAIDVNGTDQPADLEAFVQGAGIPASATIHWGIDTTGAIAHVYGVQILETTIVIDTHGQIVYRSNGAVPPEQLAQIVRNLA